MANKGSSLGDMRSKDLNETWQTIICAGDRALKRRAVSLAVGPVMLGWIRAQVWSGRSRSREKVAASRYLCYSTTQLLYQGTENQKNEAKKSHLPSWAPSLACGAQGRRFDPWGRHRLSPTVLKLNHCHVPILACWCLIIVMVAVLHDW